jgi:fluoride ion exporter CrcB/FEX
MAVMFLVVPTCVHINSWHICSLDTLCCALLCCAAAFVPPAALLSFAVPGLLGTFSAFKCVYGELQAAVSRQQQALLAAAVCFSVSGCICSHKRHGNGTFH